LEKQAFPLEVVARAHLESPILTNLVMARYNSEGLAPYVFQCCDREVLQWGACKYLRGQREAESLNPKDQRMRVRSCQCQV
jgi:hypothetical protein